MLRNVHDVSSWCTTPGGCVLIEHTEASPDKPRRIPMCSLVLQASPWCVDPQLGQRTSYGTLSLSRCTCGCLDTRFQVCIGQSLLPATNTTTRYGTSLYQHHAACRVEREEGNHPAPNCGGNQSSGVSGRRCTLRIKTVCLFCS